MIRAPESRQPAIAPRSLAVLPPAPFSTSSLTLPLAPTFKSVEVIVVHPVWPETEDRSPLVD